MDPDPGIPIEPAPSVFNYVLSFLLVGVAWGFTTPFIRRAAADFNARQAKQANDPNTSARRRRRSQDSARAGFTDAGEAQELLSREEEDSDSGADVPRRSTSSDVNRKPKTAGQDTGLAEQSGSRDREDREGGADEDEDDVPMPAWRHGGPVKQSWLRAKIVSVFWTVVNLLRTPAYAIPLVINLTGSIWFFLLVGKHELSLTVPLANSSAFLFTVLGEWYVDRKVIAKETWLGMGLVLGGIALCVHSKNQAS
ncbi:hypothetical protein DTO006G1_2086 [Penicillium roqueforti]|uniref:Uncharacterized protein family UPF0546 n=1 Tax=Penicillium roqueforti (strain FM164) TaxID=1365484 RepID=W6QD37_PENRF|nr:uncharacterized protein LCP9604111_372 [Penicillium roqueforti]CDM32104.1 Uncharacterised protein family UPF0546 [Penicillium roqueforti FM164]KAF9252846.1 hypothetical protein LCP9604111_372 [Penicillium roqueforti]KAI1830651.1 hypothetical protein CBS147337_8499 [Penicillium roqueforti]KAI2676056.1 hypothetical protein CBS147355_6237 [Penicillium roqueforti]KAI2679257.1 hypothetical protein LCP963914a_7356 [Penicillium roqueforti]